jgi:hypothetical protein
VAALTLSPQAGRGDPGRRYSAAGDSSLAAARSKLAARSHFVIEGRRQPVIG